MDGVLCDSEHLSRLAAIDVFAEMGIPVIPDDFVPFMETGKANFLGGVASVKGVYGFDPEAAKARFFDIYLDKYAKPESGIGFPGALELIMQYKENGLKVAVASSADRIKVNANLLLLVCHCHLANMDFGHPGLSKVPVCVLLASRKILYDSTCLARVPGYGSGLVASMSLCAIGVTLRLNLRVKGGSAYC